MVAKRKRIKVPEISQEKMKKIWKEKFGKKEVISQTTPFRNLVIGSLIINMVVFLLALVLHRLLPPEVPLFYGRPEGEAQLASSWLFVLPALLSLAILLVNLALSSSIKEDFLKKTLIIAGVAATFFSTITTLKIFFLVGSI